MIKGQDDIIWKDFFKSLAITAVFNTIIALFITGMGFGDTLGVNFIFAQCIGLSICGCVSSAYHLFATSRPVIQFLIVIIAMILATAAGSALGIFLTGIDPGVFLQQSSFFIQVLLLGLLFGSVITYFFVSREKIMTAEAQFQEEKIKRLTSEKKAAEAHLKQLQAQIEPHFLFNTLSNVLSLIETDPAKGKSMLLDFIQYLRTSLTKIREDECNVGFEIEMIRAYLNIYKVRMGDRLTYTVDLPGHLVKMPLPPMLLQPLVENAITHGLEPKIDGGEIRIQVAGNNGILRLEVADTGLGFAPDKSCGMGISNIKERLKSLYGNNARLKLEENSPGGVKATLEVPCDADQSDHR